MSKVREGIFISESPRVSPCDIPKLPEFAAFKHRFCQDFGQIVARAAAGDAYSFSEFWVH